MKKRIALFIMAIITSYTFAFANNSIDKLKSFANVANKGSEIGFLFTAIDKNGSMLYNSQGTTLVYNEMFSLDVPDELLIVDNKVNRWLYKINDEEIIVMDATLQEASIADNPFAFLRSENLESIKNYTIEVKDRTGKTLPSLKSVPQKIILTSLAGIKYIIEINSFKESPQLSSYNFVLDVAKYPNTFVVEM